MDDPNLMHVQSKDLYLHIVQEVGECLENGLYTDLMIRCKEGQTLHAHKLVLSSVSPYLKWLLETNEWEELQTLELPDATMENIQLLLEVVYNGEVEATIEDLRDMILLAHRLYISIPLSADLMKGLDLKLPKLPAFRPPPKPATPADYLKAAGHKGKAGGSANSSPNLPALKAAAAAAAAMGGGGARGFNPLMNKKNNSSNMPRMPGMPPLQAKPPMAAAAAAAAAAARAANGGGVGPFRRKLDPSVITAIMANSKNSEHVCPLCNIKFTKATAFKAHMKTHDDNEQLREQRNAVLGEMVATCFNPTTSLYTCHVCNSNYNHSGNFKQHLLKHERESGSISATLMAHVGGNPHLTSVLQSAMTDRVDKCDQESEEKMNKYRCEHCGRGFKHPGNYKQHLQSHIKTPNGGGGGALKRPFFDGNIEAGAGKYMRGDDMDDIAVPEHLSLVTAPAAAAGGIKRESPGASSSSFSSPSPGFKTMHRCDICQQTFRSEAFLNQHKMSFHKIATPSTPESGQMFYCNVCGKGFKQMAMLTKHSRTHGPSAEHYKYPCTLCGKKFTRPHHVTRHMLLHTGENPFKCSQCSAAFPRIESLRTHEAKGCGRLKAMNEGLGFHGLPLPQFIDTGASAAAVAGAEEEEPIAAEEDDDDDEAPEEMIVEAGLIEMAPPDDDDDDIADDESLEEVGGGAGGRSAASANGSPIYDENEDGAPPPQSPIYAENPEEEEDEDDIAEPETIAA